MKTINPTFGQAVEYAFKTGYSVPLFIGVAIIVGLIIYMIMRYKMSGRLKDGFLFNYPFVVVFIGLAIAISLILVKPTGIQTDNEKPVTDAQFEYYQSKGDNFKTFWDSVYNNNRMLGAAKR